MKLKNSELIAMGNLKKINIPKSYAKAKIISRLVESIVGNNIDDDSIYDNNNN